MRLTRTVNLTTATAPTLQFAVSYDTEANYDYVFVEAHTPGQDDCAFCDPTMILPKKAGHGGITGKTWAALGQLPKTRILLVQGGETAEGKEKKGVRA